MTLHQRILDAARNTRTALYVLTAFYVCVGFAIAVPAAMAGDRLATFLGFVIVSGALGAGVIISTLLRISTRISAIGESVDDTAERLDALEEKLQTITEATSAAPPVSVWGGIDLASFGQGDPDRLVAAQLDRDAFPRLVRTMEAEPPAESVMAAPTESGHPSPTPAQVLREDAGDVASSAHAMNTRSLLQEWRAGLQRGDLAACRRVYSAMVDTTEPTDLTPLRLQLEELADRTERRLRRAFQRHLRRQDYAGMLEVGEQIARLLPDRPIAGDFDRIRPHLRRRVQEEQVAPEPALRVVR